MVQRRSQKRKAADDGNKTEEQSFLSPPRQESSMAVFDFRSPSSDPSIEDSSPSISSASFYKTPKNQKKRTILSPTENILTDVKTLTAKSDGLSQSKKRLRSSLSQTKKLIPVSAKTPNIGTTTKDVKNWSPMRADDALHASTPGNQKKSKDFTNINDIVSAVTSDSPVGKFGLDDSDSENDASVLEVSKRPTRKELFCGTFSAGGKFSNKLYSKLLSPRKHSPKKRESLTPDVNSGKRFFKHRKCLSENKAGKGTRISIGKGFNLKFTPHGQKPSAGRAKQPRSSSARKSIKTSRFSRLEFTSDITKTGEEIVRLSCATVADDKNENGAPIDNEIVGEVDCAIAPIPNKVSSVVKSPGEILSENSIVSKMGDSSTPQRDVLVEDNSVSKTGNSSSESEHPSQCSMELFSSIASSNPIDQILDGFGFDDDDAPSDVSNLTSTITKVADEERVMPVLVAEVDDGWSTQSVASSSDMTVSSTAANPDTGFDNIDGTPSQKKLFPVFTRSPKQSPKMQSHPESPKVSPKSQTKSCSVKGSGSSPRSVKNRLEDMKEGLEQYALDFGQKTFGITQCGTCGMVYTAKEPTDEAHHSKFHQKVLTALRFPKFKKQSVVQEFPNGSCIIVVYPDDKFAQKKVDAILSVVDEDLGFSEIVRRVMQHKKTFVYISEQRRVIGCCVAEAINQAYPVLTDSQRSTQLSNPEQQRAWCCSTESVLAKCGISRIWVFRNERRKGVATQLLDCVRRNFFLGNYLEKSEIAFTDPTPDGRCFAANFTEMPNFLVYNK